LKALQTLASGRTLFEGKSYGRPDDGRAFTPIGDGVIGINNANSGDVFF
jgi:hypothetical protein